LPFALTWPSLVAQRSLRGRLTRRAAPECVSLSRFLAGVLGKRQDLTPMTLTPARLRIMMQ
jgi:hypothetical protein